MTSVINNNGILEVPMTPKYQPDPRGLGTSSFYKMKEFSDKIAQIDVETNKSETYGEILTKSIRVALKIKSLGITDEDIVTICTGTHTETCLPFWASIFSGIKQANLDPTLSLDDMKYLTNITKPKLIFCGTESVANLEIVIKQLNLDTKLIVFGETGKHIPFKECLKPQKGEEDFKPKLQENLFNTLSILYSSGTTGLPKGVCITHYGMLYMINYVIDYYDLESLVLYTTPYWISYIILVSSTLFAGGHRNLCEFKPKNFLQLIQDFKVSFTFLPPTFTYAITANAGDNFEDIDISSLTSIMIGGGCIGADQLEKVRKVFKNCFLSQVYGLTEISGIFSASSRKYDCDEIVMSKPTACGRMLPDTMCKVVDIETNEILGPNKSGELLIKANRLMNGYYNDPQRTAEVYDEDGFLHTGDVLYYDDDYYFYAVDRIKEMFKYKSWHIVPAELENILLKHPAVKEVLVIGYPNEEDGDHPMAVIIPNKDVNVTEDDIIQYFNGQVVDRKKLRGGVKFVTSLPKTVTGKYSRRNLRTMVINKEI